MRKQGPLEKMERVIESLTLAQRLRKTEFPAKRELDWDELYGLGKGLWAGQDAEDYVGRHREDRF